MPGMNIDADRARMRRLAADRATIKAAEDRIVREVEEEKDRRFVRSFDSVQRKRTNYPFALRMWEAPRRAPRSQKIPGWCMFIGGVMIFGAWTGLVITESQWFGVLLVLGACLFMPSFAIHRAREDHRRHIPQSRPKPPRFTREESRVWMYPQSPGNEVTTFTALCACPGCQTLDTHGMREVEPEVAILDRIDPHDPATWYGDSQWATVIRQCGVCEFEWPQQ